MKERNQQFAVMHKVPTPSHVLKSNMSKLKVNIEDVYQYSVEFFPEVDDSLTKKKRVIVKGASEELLSKLGHYIHLGNNIYSLKKAQSFKAPTNVKDTETEENLEIGVKFIKSISMKGLDRMSSDGIQEVEMVFNIFLKKVMEGQKLFQLRSNSFFDLSTVKDISQTSLMIVTGYFVSISYLKEGLFLTLDTVNEIFKKTNCFDDLLKLKKQGCTEKEIGLFFNGRRVTVPCLKNKSIRISGVNFKMTPKTCIIESESMALSLLWEKKYNVHLSSQIQPLLTYKKDKMTHYLIPEFCYLTGLEEDSRQCSKVMSELAQCGTDPTEKFTKIQGMFNNLIKSKAFNECGLELSSLPEALPTKILPAPLLSLGKAKYFTMQDLSKGVPVMNPINFSKWLCIYEKDSYSLAESLYTTMQKASPKLQISISEPEWLELSNLNSRDVQQFLKGTASAQFQFVLVLLSDRRQYVQIKKLLEVDLGITSQFVHLTPKKVSSFSIASNIIKQINLKIGGELYKVDLPNEVPKNTMFVGIDVCHCGRESIVGFYSNASTTLSRCYCDTAPQKKGQEIISILVPFYKKALQLYLHDQKKLPDYIMIYRDGVGRSQRKQVISVELPQVINVFKNFKGDYNPKVTLIIVNKRIHQRFIKENHGIFANPQPGTIVDDYVIEKDCSNFYLVSAISRIGTVRPAHYYIAYNENKEVTTEVIQKVSFATSHMYSHAGCPVKVPAHIALADKKANLMSILRGNSNEKLIFTQSFI